MMFKKYHLLLLNGKQYSPSELQLRCNQKLKTLSNQNWEYKLYSFIAEWLNESPTMNARTSGTTGTPKEISIRKDKALQSAKLTIRQLQLHLQNTAVLCLSCEHIAGKMMIVRAFAGELNLITKEPTFNPLKSVPIDQKIDFASFVPMQVKEILSDRKTAKQFAQIKCVLIGGAPVSQELKVRLRKMKNAVYETYGMTETISHIALKNLSNGNVYFTTLEGITIGTDERSCLVINAPHISSKPIITNDIVELKDARNFKWLGRYDNVVNSGGIKLMPELLEEKIRDTVQRRYFFKGMPDVKIGEKLVLYIEGKEFAEGELNQLRNKLNKVLGKYEMPKEIIFLPKFKTTASGKIER